MNNSREIREFVMTYMWSTVRSLGYMNESQLQKMPMLDFERLYNKAWDKYVLKMGV